MDTDTEQPAAMPRNEAGAPYLQSSASVHSQQTIQEPREGCAEPMPSAGAGAHLPAEADTQSEDVALTPEELQREYERVAAATPACLRSAVAPYAPVPGGANVPSAQFLLNGGSEMLRALCDADHARQEAAEELIMGTLLAQQVADIQYARLTINVHLNSGGSYIHDMDALLPLAKLADTMIARAASLIRLRRALRSPTGSLNFVLQGQNQQLNVNAAAPDPHPDR